MDTAAAAAQRHGPELAAMHYQVRINLIKYAVYNKKGAYDAKIYRPRR